MLKKTSPLAMITFVSFALIAACGGISSSANEAGGGGAGSSGKALLCRNPAALTVDGQDTGFDTCESGSVGSPLRQRRVAAACVNPSPAACSAGTCRSDADCKTSGNVPRHCAPIGGSGASCVCLYGCTTDADCGSSGICACYGSGGRCQRASCKSNADCPNGLLCAEHEPTTCGGDRAFACQSPEDDCLVASDCSSGEACNFDGKKRTCGPRPTCVDP